MSHQFKTDYYLIFILTHFTFCKVFQYFLNKLLPGLLTTYAQHIAGGKIIAAMYHRGSACD